jgi:hypothetical protein
MFPKRFGKQRRFITPLYPHIIVSRTTIVVEDALSPDKLAGRYGCHP